MTHNNYMKYEIDGDTADNIAKGVLKETMESLESEIKKLKKVIKQGPVGSYILEDYNDNKKYLKAAELMYEYFGGNLK